MIVGDIYRSLVNQRKKKRGEFPNVADFAFEKPLRGPGAHEGVTFAPSGLISYDLLPWITPAVEYYVGVGIGTTKASRGTFLKSIIGWTF